MKKIQHYMQNYHNHSRCLYKKTVSDFLQMNPIEVFGNIVQSFHGVDQTTTNAAWMGEIEIMQKVCEYWGVDYRTWFDTMCDIAY